MHPPPVACTRSGAPPGTAVTLTGARVFSHHGVLIDSENRLFDDLSPDLRPPPEGHRILKYPGLPDPVTVTGSVFSLATPSSQKSYFHWLLDAVPRLRHVDLQTFDFFHTSLLHPCHAETLDRLGIPRDRRLEATADSHFLCENLTTVSPLPLGAINAADRDFLRPLFAQETPTPSRRLYFSRGDAWRRRIINEEELLALITPLGFETIHCSKHSIDEQAALASEAEIILAPHGAALTNLVFAPPTCRVIELVSENYQYPYFEDLAAVCGLAYQRHLSANPDNTPDHPLDLESFRKEVLPNLS